MAVRGSIEWCENPAVTKLCSITSLASAKPASRSPNAHSSAGRPRGSSPSGTAKSPASHLISCKSRRTFATLPFARAFGPPGYRLSSGSSVNGSGSRSTLIFSIASAAVVSSTAATARIGSPTNSGSMVRIGFSGGGNDGTSSAVRMPATPSMASASEASMLRTRACGIGLVSSLQNSMPSARKSSAYLARPVTLATTSGGTKSLPIRL